MRIPLDLYQILGVPIQATPDHIKEAFGDRCQQLPRQEYSKTAIAARTQLLQDAYTMLSDPDTRAAYDESILAESAASTTEIEGMELLESQLVGALLLLQEQSDYDRIAQLGSAYLQRSIDLNQLPAASHGADEDVILAMALANLEAGRDCWQQNQFEKASDVLQSGLKMLTQEQLFPSVQQEIELDLFKLRPYRILELLADPEAISSKRQQGLTLLQTMLDERGGIDGQDDDLSGLNVDDFLRFIQQLRCYLTVQEQQELFEKEAERPSAVAHYLSIYALVARGCSQGQPEYIQQARTTLTQLADRQDVQVEKAMCSLLLGQPGAAIQTLPLSRDQESLEFIQQYSEGAEDLVPGLFLYTERWLQQEVYPYFRDLTDTTVSLQTYFNDEHIQAYLDTLEPEPMSSQMPIATTSADLPLLAQGNETLSSVNEGRLSAQIARHQTSTEPSEQSSRQRMQPVEPLTPLPARSGAGAQQQDMMPASQPPNSTPVNTGKNGPSSIKDRPRYAYQKRSQLQYRRWFFMAGAVFLGLLALLGLISQCSRPENSQPEVQAPPATEPNISTNPIPNVSPSTSPSTSPTPPPSRPSASPTPTPSASPSSVSPPPATPPATTPLTSDKITTENARQIIQTWQTAKAEAMGANHQTNSLGNILVDPSLSEWKASAQAGQANQSYLQYTINDISINAIRPQGPTQVSIDATVKETGKVFERGQLSTADSYTDDTYRVRYEMIREQDQWKIQKMTLQN